MNDIQPKPMSKKDLAIATAVSAGLAFVVLMVAVLPAEFGIDPTGLGGVFGLTSDDHAGPSQDHVAEPGTWRTHNMSFVLGPNSNWVEEKVGVKAGQSFVYSWSADGPVRYDLHGKPDGQTGEPSFDAGTATAANGTLQAPFDGLVGWAFRNETGQTITIRVQMAGFFEP